jgi:hypothetical protein
VSTGRSFWSKILVIALIAFAVTWGTAEWTAWPLISNSSKRPGFASCRKHHVGFGSASTRRTSSLETWSSPDPADFALGLIAFAMLLCRDATSRLSRPLRIAQLRETFEMLHGWQVRRAPALESASMNDFVPRRPFRTYARTLFLPQSL